MLEGLNDVLANLENAIDKIKVCESVAIDRGCQVIENKAKELCPVDDGILRASITHKVQESSVGTITGTVGTGVEYAPYVHQGTGLFAVNGDGRKEPWVYKDAKGQFHKTIGQKPQPFLLDASIGEMDAVIRQISEVMKNAF